MSRSLREATTTTSLPPPSSLASRFFFASDVSLSLPSAYPDIATHITEELGNGEVRFIARLKKSVVPNGSVSAEVSNGELSDEFGSERVIERERGISTRAHCGGSRGS